LTKACADATVFYGKKMFKKGAQAPYTPLSIVGLLLPGVLRVPNSKNGGAKKACTHPSKACVEWYFV